MKTVCTSLVNAGLGLGSLDGKNIFLPGILLGEEVEVFSTAEKKNHLVLIDGEISKASPLRIKPSCPYSEVCGGCDFDYVDEKASAEIKQSVVVFNIENRSGRRVKDVLLPPVYGPRNGYRARARLHVSMKERKIGFLKKKSNELVEIRECPLLSDNLNAILAEPKKVFSCAQSYLFSKGVNSKTGFVELSLFDTGSAVLIENDEGVINIGSYSFRLSGSVFFQSNTRLLPSLFDFIQKNTKGETVMDLYSGVGTFSTLFEGSSKSLVAVEKDKRCLSFARKNAPSASFFTEDVALWARKGRGVVDTVIVDPPRTGLQGAGRLISSWRPERIIYVSCNSETLANDLNDFGEYSISSGMVLDFYPGSFHEETVLVLDKR